MQLDRVDINNFRSIKDLTLHFTQRCQSLIGINESGKSNILRALHLLDRQATASPKDLRIERHDEPQVTAGYVRFIFKLSDEDIADVTAKMAAHFCQQSIQDPLVAEKSATKSLGEWCASRREGNFKITLPDGKRTETMWAVRKGEQIVPHWFRNKTSESVDVPIDGDTHLSVPANGYVRLPSTVEPSSASFEAAGLDKLAALSIETVRELMVEQLPGCIFWRYADQYLLPSTIDMTAFCDSPDTCIPLKSMFELAGYDIDKLKETITNAQAQGHYRYTQILEKTASAATEHIRSVWKDHKTIRLKLEPNGNSLSPMIVDDVVPLDMANRSDGFKRFVSFLLQISAKVRTAELKNTLILIDEPEIALHPTGAKSLMQELIKIGESNYVVYSTHSIFMIDKSNIARHLVVEKKNEVTTTWRAEKSRIQDEEVLYSAIGYSIFETLKEHNVIFEGWRDKELFRIVAESMGRADKQTKDMLAAIGVTFADGVKDVKNVAHFLQLASRPCLIISDADTVALQHRKAYLSPGAWGTWKTLREILPAAAVTTAEDLLLRSAVVRRANKVRSTHENLAVLTEQHFNAGETTWAGLRRWLEAAGLTGAALDEACNEVKLALYDGLKRTEISDEAEGIVASSWDTTFQLSRERLSTFSLSTRRALRYPTHTLAFPNIRIHGLHAERSPLVQLICTLRNTRSGCGISTVKRPSAVVTAVRPSGLPLGLCGYVSVGLPLLSTKRIARCTAAASPRWLKSAKPSPCATAMGMRLPAMPLKNRLGLSSTSTSDSHASNCSLLLRVNLGHACAPGMMGLKLAIIWQPMHTPSANVSLR